MKRMLFNATHAEEIRVATVDGQKLIDIDIESSSRSHRKSNIYKGVITRVEPSLEACFVDYGEERHGFLPYKEISRAYFNPGVDYHSATISQAVSVGRELIVQVEKDERGNKGAALTTFVSLAGRYLVLMPNNPRGGGVSRRIDGEERQELREAMEQLDLPAGMSLIARTAGIGRTAEELNWDLSYLLKLWHAIDEAAQPRYEMTVTENGQRVTRYTTESVQDGRQLKRANPAPFLIVEDSNLVIRAIRDYFHHDIAELLVDTDEIYEQARQFMSHVMPDCVSRVKRYHDETPLFSRFQLEHQIESAYSRTVALPSGGAIVVDHTEALVAVDVNSARATRGSDIEETALKTNLEAADEIARQMRLRDLGGLIVIDFIDMAEARNQREVEARLREAVKPDRARVQFAHISRFGLMELSRQRLRPSLSEGSHITCPRCNGVGVIRDTESCALQVLRIMQEEAAKENTGALHAQVPVDVATYLLNEKRSEVAKIESRFRVSSLIIPNTTLLTPHYRIERLKSDDERLDSEVASYKRAEEIVSTADDSPYTRKPKSESAGQPRQVPVIKNILPTEVAPEHKPRETQKAAESGFWAGLARAVARFFGGGAETDKPKRARRRSADGRRRGKDEARATGRDQRSAQGGKERAERGPAANQGKAQSKTQSKTQGKAQDKSQDKSQGKSQGQSGPAATDDKKAEPRGGGRRGRGRRGAGGEAPGRAADAAAASGEAPQDGAQTERQPEGGSDRSSRRRHDRKRERPAGASQGSAAEADNGGETADARPEADRAPAQSELGIPEPGTVSQPAAAPEPMTPAAESPAGTPTAPEPTPGPEAASAPAPAPELSLEEKLARAGLNQVATSQPGSGSSYEPVRYRGRPRRALPPIEEGPLEQVGTKPEPQTGPEPQSKAELKTEPKTKSELQPEPQPEPKPELKTEPKTEPEPEPGPGQV